MGIESSYAEKILKDWAQYWWYADDVWYNLPTAKECKHARKKKSGLFEKNPSAHSKTFFNFYLQSFILKTSF